MREWLDEIWQYRELFFFLVWRELKIRYKQTVLGASWAILQPVFTMMVFTIFFGKFAKIPSDGIPYPIFTYSALLPWTYFAGVLNFSGNSLITNVNLITKVYFPRIALPTATALSGLVDFALAFIVLLLMMVYYDIQIGWPILLWIFLIIPLFMLALGVGMFLAAVNVKYRDIKYTIPFGIQMWLFLTPVIYPTSIIPEKFRLLALINPMTGLIEAFRTAIIPGRPFEWQILGISLISCVSIFLFGLTFFRNIEKTFADTV